MQSDNINEKEHDFKIPIDDLIQSFHDDPMFGHLGVKKTLKKLQQRYSFPNMKISIEII